MPEETIKYAALTTMSEAGRQQHGAKMIDTFGQFWPASVDLHVFSDKELLDLSHDLRTFRSWATKVPILNGNVNGDYSFLLDAVRFAWKSFAVIDGMKNVDADVVFWLDADIVTHGPVTFALLKEVMPEWAYTCYLGRTERWHHSECSFVGYRKTHEHHNAFMDAWRNLLMSGHFLQANAWNDCIWYDMVRDGFEKADLIRSHNISKSDHCEDMEHPFVCSRLGNVMDHLKGPARKQAGKSFKEDLNTNRGGYWNDLEELVTEATDSLIQEVTTQRLISDEHRALNRKLLEIHAVYGKQGFDWFDDIKDWISDNRETINRRPVQVLDYGCGDGSLHRKFLGDPSVQFWNYDPANPQHAEPPPDGTTFDLIVCADVLPCVEPENLDVVLDHLMSYGDEDTAYFFVVSHAPAKMRLPDGTNPRKIVEGPDYWLGKLRFSLGQAHIRGQEPGICTAFFAAKKSPSSAVYASATDHVYSIGDGSEILDEDIVEKPVTICCFWNGPKHTARDVENLYRMIGKAMSHDNWRFVCFTDRDGLPAFIEQRPLSGCLFLGTSVTPITLFDPKFVENIGGYPVAWIDLDTVVLKDAAELFEGNSPKLLRDTKITKDGRIQYNMGFGYLPDGSLSGVAEVYAAAPERIFNMATKQGYEGPGAILSYLHPGSATLDYREGVYVADQIKPGDASMIPSDARIVVFDDVTAAKGRHPWLEDYL